MRRNWRGLNLAFVAVIICAQLINVFHPAASYASPLLVQSSSTAASASKTAGASLTAATAGDVLIVICGVTGNATITGPPSFTAAINETGTSSQAIFYKVAVGGETSFICTSSSTSYNVISQAYEYSGINTTTPLDATNTVASTGSSSSYASGSVTTTYAGDILLAGFVLNTGTTVSSWSNSFTQELSGANSSGKSTARYAYGSADYTASATGTFSTVATGSASSSWRGQIAAFRPQNPPVLSVDVVDGTGVSVPSPSISFAATSTSFSCQTVNATLGTSAQKIRVNNTTGNPAWTVSIAATSGNTSTWTSGTNAYSYNDATSSGCATGQLQISTPSALITPASGCSSSYISIGAGAYFAKGTTDAITLASASTSSNINCYWDITSITMTQQIPAEQKPGTYSLGMTITVVAN